jgi:hypothetical protein
MSTELTNLEDQVMDLLLGIEKRSRNRKGGGGIEKGSGAIPFGTVGALCFGRNSMMLMSVGGMLTGKGVPAP